MLIGQAEGIQLLPDTTETVWGLVSVLMLIGLVMAVVGLLVWTKRAADQRARLEARLERLERSTLEKGPQ